MKTVQLAEAARDLEMYLREAASGERIVVLKGSVALGSLSPPPYEFEPLFEEHLHNLARQGAVILAAPDSAAIRHARRPIGEGKGTAASDWIMGDERDERA